MSNYLPFKVTFTQNGESKELLANSRKNAVSHARPLRKKGISVMGHAWDSEVEEWGPDSKLQDMIYQLPTTTKEPESKGSLTHYNALKALSAATAYMSDVAKRRALKENEVTDLVEHILSVCGELDIDLADYIEGDVEDDGEFQPFSGEVDSYESNPVA